MNDVKHIITLGCPASGKTNYMACALAYIGKYMTDVIAFKGNEKNFSILLDQVQEDLQEGNWLDKTQVKRDYCFESKISRKWFWRRKHSEVQLHDWTGEAFDELEDLSKWHMAPEHKDSFLNDLCLSEYILILVDARCLLNKKLTSKYRKCLAGLQEELQKAQKIKKRTRHFAIAVSKADMLESTGQWGIKEAAKKVFTSANKYCALLDGGLQVQKIKSDVEKQLFDVFFRYAAWEGFPYEICPVSCIPKREHRIHDTKRGLIPSSQWSLEDLKDQMTPFKWIFKDFVRFPRDL